MSAAEHSVVIALGGNAISRFGDDGSVAAQYQRSAEAMHVVADLVAGGWHVALTHGNGPVIGSIVLRGELACASVPPTPLFISGADAEGGIGLMLQQVLGNELRARGIATPVATIVTQVVVDADDPAFELPSKPIGRWCDSEEAARRTAEKGWLLAEEPGRGWRRIVASPRPRRIVEAPAILALLEAGALPIAAGGGGVPVIEDATGQLAGVEAVIDKDWTAALLAHALGIPLLAILMEHDAIYTDFGTPEAQRIGRLGASQAFDLAERLPAGSVGPKLAAAAWFAQHGGRTAICRAEELSEALAGAAGTTVHGS